MKPYRIINIQDLLSVKKGDAYKGEVAVFHSSIESDSRLFGGEPAYVNAFLYVLITSGSALLLIGDDEYPVYQDTLCILLPVHLCNFRQMTDDFQCITLCLHKDFIDRLPAVQVQHCIARSVMIYHSPFTFVTEEEREVLKKGIEHIRKQLSRTGHLYLQELIQNSVTFFYLEVDNIFEQKKKKGTEMTDEQQPRHAEILRQFTSLLLLHYKKEHTVPFYAQKLNITPQYLTSIVKAQTGHTVNDFIYEILYCESRNLLISSGLSIQQIAIELNFSDQAAFSKFFKRRSGVSPFEYRKP